MKRIDRIAIASVMVATAACLTLPLSGCGSPSHANIELRKENATLTDSLSVTKSERDANAATIRALQARSTTVPVLPQAQLEELVTTHNLHVGRLTSIKPATDALNASTQPTSSQYILEVHAAPIDETGDSIKAAGSFAIDAFDLSKPGENRIGHWDFTAAQARSLWLSGLLVYEYALPCPLQTMPAEDQTITVRVTFADELTHRSFTNQIEIHPTPIAKAK